MIVGVRPEVGKGHAPGCARLRETGIAGPLARRVGEDQRGGGSAQKIDRHAHPAREHGIEQLDGQSGGDGRLVVIAHRNGGGTALIIGRDQIAGGIEGSSEHPIGGVGAEVAEQRRTIEVDRGREGLAQHVGVREGRGLARHRRDRRKLLGSGLDFQDEVQTTDVGCRLGGENGLDARACEQARRDEQRRARRRQGWDSRASGRQREKR
ncbi:hypothetical protein D3C86_1352220 [compost metagenome]